MHNILKQQHVPSLQLAAVQKEALVEMKVRMDQASRQHQAPVHIQKCTLAFLGHLRDGAEGRPGRCECGASDGGYCGPTPVRAALKVVERPRRCSFGGQERVCDAKCARWHPGGDGGR